MKDRLRFVAFSLAVFAVFLVAIELTARIVYYGGEIANWRNLFSFRNTMRGSRSTGALLPRDLAMWRGAMVSTNPLGFRTPPFSIEKPPGTYRIVALGGRDTGCITAGYGVEDWEIWPRLLEEGLNQAPLWDGPRRWEVVNLAIPHWISERVRTFQGALEQAVAVDADLIIFQYPYRSDKQEREAGEAARLGIPFVHVNYPGPAKNVSREGLDRFLGTYAIGKRERDWRMHLFPMDRGHPGPEGHLYVAERVYEILLEHSADLKRWRRNGKRSPHPYRWGPRDHDFARAPRWERFQFLSAYMIEFSVGQWRLIDTWNHFIRWWKQNPDSLPPSDSTPGLAPRVAQGE